MSSEIAPEIALVVPADRIAGGNSGRLRDGGSEIAASEKSVGSRFETRLRAICSFVSLLRRSAKAGSDVSTCRSSFGAVSPEFRPEY